MDADQKWKFIHRKIPTLQADHSIHSNMGTVMQLLQNVCMDGVYTGKSVSVPRPGKRSTKLVLITTVWHQYLSA